MNYDSPAACGIFGIACLSSGSIALLALAAVLILLALFGVIRRSKRDLVR